MHHRQLLCHNATIYGFHIELQLQIVYRQQHCLWQVNGLYDGYTGTTDQVYLSFTKCYKILLFELFHYIKFTTLVSVLECKITYTLILRFTTTT